MGSASQLYLWGYLKLAPLDRWHKHLKQGYALQTTKGSIGPAFLALFLITTATSTFAGVYKWVDENGHAYYSEKPPEQGKHTQLRAPPEPDIRRPATWDTPARPKPKSTGKTVIPPRPKLTTQQRMEEVSAKLKAERDLDAEREKVKENQRRYDDQEAENNTKIEKMLIDKCKRDREVYCDKGVDKIKQEESQRQFDGEMEKRRARFNH